MKDFWRKHHKWIIPVIVLILIFLTWIVLYLNGIRLCYNPKLAITWEHSAVIADWLGAIATIVGVIVSGIAIFYAVSVPKKIAIQQNKISLFEKKLNCYSTVCDIIACSNAAKYSQNSNDVFRAFYGTYGEYDGNKNQVDITPILVNLNRQLPIVKSGIFLFSNYDSDAARQMLLAAASLLDELKMDNIEEAIQPLSKDANTAKEKLCTLCDEFNEKYMHTMEDELSLN